MKSPTIAIITRMSFEKDLTEVQLRQFKDVYLKSLANQEYKAFTVYILANKVRDFIGSEKNRETIKEIVSTCDFDIRVEDSEKHKYDIEFRLDFDDEIVPNFTKVLVEQYHRYPHDTYLLNFQPVICDNSTGLVKDRRYYQNPRKYDSNGASMCIALIQKGEKKHWVYQRPHIAMAKHVGRVYNMGQGFFYLHAHGENALTRVPGNAIPIR